MRLPLNLSHRSSGHVWWLSPIGGGHPVSASSFPAKASLLPGPAPPRGRRGRGHLPPVQLYLAARHDDGSDRSSTVTRDGGTHPLRCGTSTTELSQALVTNYLMRPAERFRPLAAQGEFLDALGSPSPDGIRRGRIGVDFGSVSLCHVAAGFTDATVEFVKGFAIWDLAPGHYILHAAGGTTRPSPSTASHCPSTTP